MTISPFSTERSHDLPSLVSKKHRPSSLLCVRLLLTRAVLLFSGERERTPSGAVQQRAPLLNNLEANSGRTKRFLSRYRFLPKVVGDLL